MLAMLVATGLALAQMPPAPKWELTPSPMQRDLGELCLPSAMRVTVHSEPRQPVVAVTWISTTGQASDPVGKEGVGRLLERVWLRSKAEGQLSNRERLQAMGALWHTQRTADTVVAGSEVASAQLEDLFAVQGTRFGDFLAGVSDADLAEAREALALELSAADDLDPASLALAFPAGFQPAGTLATGRLPTPSSVRSLTRADLVAALATWRPGGTTLRVAGNVTMETATNALEKAFPPDALYVAPDGTRPPRGTCKPPPAPAKAVPPTRSGKPVATASAGPVAAPTLLIGWALPPGYNETDPVARVAAKFQWRRIVSAFVSQSAARIARYRPECAYLPGAQASSFVCSLRLPEGTKPEALAQKVLDSLAATALLPTAEDGEIDVWRVADAHEISLGIGELTLLRGPEALREALEIHHRHSPVWYGAAAQATSTANAETVRSFVGEWMNNRLVQLHVVVPEAADPAKVLAATGKPDMSGLEGERLRPAALVNAWDLPLNDRGEAATAAIEAAVTSPALAGGKELMLPGGARLVVVPYGSLPKVHVAAIATTPEHVAPVAGLGDWMWEVMQPVVDTLPGENNNYARQGMHVETKFFAGGRPAARAFVFETSVGHLDQALWLLRHVVQNVEMNSSSDVRAERRYAAEDAWKLGATEPLEQARRARATALFGAGHPLMLGLTGRLVEGAKVSDKVARAYFAHTWGGPGVTIVVLGKVDVDDAVKRASAMFGTLAARKGALAGAPAVLPAPGPAGLFRQGIDRAMATTTEVVLECAVDGAAPSEVRAVGEEALVRMAAAALANIARAGTLDRRSEIYGAAGLVGVGAWVAPAQASTAATALAELVGKLNATATDTLLRGAADTVARQEVLAWGEPEEALLRLATGPQNSAEAATARAAALRNVDPAAVRAWLGGCAQRAAITATGPGAAAAVR